MRSRQKLPFMSAFPAVLLKLEADEKGVCRYIAVDQSKIKLPDTSVTDLGLQLKAGVDIKRVNTKILASKSVVTDLSVPAEPPKETEQQEQTKGE